MLQETKSIQAINVIKRLQVSPSTHLPASWISLLEKESKDVVFFHLILQTSNFLASTTVLLLPGNTNGSHGWAAQGGNASKQCQGQGASKPWEVIEDMLFGGGQGVCSDVKLQRWWRLLKAMALRQVRSSVTENRYIYVMHPAQLSA